MRSHRLRALASCLALLQGCHEERALPVRCAELAAAATVDRADAHWLAAGLPMPIHLAANRAGDVRREAWARLLARSERAGAVGDTPKSAVTLAQVRLIRDVSDARRGSTDAQRRVSEAPLYDVVRLCQPLRRWTLAQREDTPPRGGGNLFPGLALWLFAVATTAAALVAVVRLRAWDWVLGPVEVAPEPGPSLATALQVTAALILVPTTLTLASSDGLRLGTYAAWSLVLGLAWVRRTDFTRTPPQTFALSTALAVSVATVAPRIAWWPLAVFPHGPLEDLRGGFDAGVAAEFVKACLLGPFVEEIVFTAGMLPVLRRHLDLRAAALVTGLVFACVHRDPTPGRMVELMVSSTVGCLIFARTRNLAIPIVAHMLHNSILRWLALAQIAAAG